MDTIKLLAIMLVLVMVSACLNQPTRTNTSSSSSNSSLTTSPREYGDVNPPEIVGFNWTPTKIVWDKVYDIRVSFKVVDDESIERVVLKFIPVEYQYFITKYGMRPEDYPKVFPPEKERVYELKPVDGVFDEPIEEFSANITNITGGAEYWIIIQVQTKNGRTREYKTKTAYIRQYENNAKKDNVIVMASYMPWYTGHFWIRDYDPRGYPLLGAYNVRDPIVIYKHADWATGFGIDVFLMNWNEDDKAGDENARYILHILRNFEGAPEIGILWGPHPNIMVSYEAGRYNMDMEYNWKEFLNEFEYLALNYMNNSLYFQFNGKSVVYLYDSKALRGNIPKLMFECRENISQKYGIQLFLIGDEIGWLFTYPEEWFEIEGSDIERLKSFDAISDWAGSHDRSKKEYIEKYEKYLDALYREWSDFLRKEKIGFVPSVIPGFDEVYIYYKPYPPPIPKTPYFFKIRLKIALNYLDPDLKMIRIDTWNDFSEWSNVEPTREEGFIFLETLKEVLGEYMEKQEKD